MPATCDSPRNRVWKPEYGIPKRGITVERLFERLKGKRDLSDDEVDFQRIADPSPDHPDI
ncbi:hypothetical protein QBC45DRAFT_393021 [Copromyces sp. CBS 386.78]|nr:hypothetical protein QBC45DRAFT_393021 [Copromyces sp. CBS 386.78]